MSTEDLQRFNSMKLFMHQIYEYRKGIRRLVLCTLSPACARLLGERLDREGISWRIQPVTERKVNLYFGDQACLRVVGTFIDKSLNKLTPAEDFMLGAMLGYDIGQQCERFCRRAAI